MIAKLICNNCKTEVGNISILFKDVAFRKDMTVVNGHNSNPFLVEYDREYAASKVDSVIYNCKCGEKVIKNDSNLYSFLDDFGRIDGNLDLYDLQKEQYGDLKIVVINNSLAGTVQEL